MIVIMKFETRKRTYSAAVCSLSSCSTLLFTKAHLLGGGLFPHLKGAKLKGSKLCFQYTRKASFAFRLTGD